jgi:hypothetical protein
MTSPPPVEPGSAIEITAGGPWSLAAVAKFFAGLDSIYLYAHDQAQFAGTTERLKAIGEDAREGDAALQLGVTGTVRRNKAVACVRLIDFQRNSRWGRRAFPCRKGRNSPAYVIC